MIKKEDEKFFSAFGDMTGDAVNENKCYYIKRIEEYDWSSKIKKFTRIEFYKPWFFYLQDFRSFSFWWNSIFWHCWGGNDKYEMKCSDIITLINGEKITEEEKYNINESDLVDKFTNEEIKIIKFICYLYQINGKSFERVIFYLKKNIVCDMVDWCRRD